MYLGKIYKLLKTLWCIFYTEWSKTRCFIINVTTSLSMECHETPKNQHRLQMKGKDQLWA